MERSCQSQKVSTSMIFPHFCEPCIPHNANDGIYRRLNQIRKSSVPTAYLLNHLAREKLSFDGSLQMDRKE